MGGDAREVHLFDLMGRERMNAVMDGANVALDVSSLPPGLYIVSDGRSQAKFVKE